MSIATATHITKNAVRIKAEEGYGITFFQISGKDIEVIITAIDGNEAARLLVQAPKEDEKLIVDKSTDGTVVDFIYEKI